ncbi:hypothetical protein KUTeg_020719 [Tegillarca granosa]|uniref:Uncharacterized protein n=1 Tax=Tegillarca granosa TaxID=220873 RepID=A0ABQ9E8U2_TEGGR|nr:hypothetical protein KUTeg_020719 [Tegillarca granosa]
MDIFTCFFFPTIRTLLSFIRLSFHFCNDIRFHRAWVRISVVTTNLFYLHFLLSFISVFISCSVQRSCKMLCYGVQSVDFISFPCMAWVQIPKMVTKVYSYYIFHENITFCIGLKQNY